MHHHVSNDIAVSPIMTLACLAPGHVTCTSLSALVDLSGPAVRVSLAFGIYDIAKTLTIFHSSEFDPLEWTCAPESALARWTADIEEAADTASDFPDRHHTFLERDSEEATSVGRKGDGRYGTAVWFQYIEPRRRLELIPGQIRFVIQLNFDATYMMTAPSWVPTASFCVPL